jgi:hypothetical protein
VVGAVALLEVVAGMVQVRVVGPGHIPRHGVAQLGMVECLLGELSLARVLAYRFLLPCPGDSASVERQSLSLSRKKK